MRKGSHSTCFRANFGKGGVAYLDLKAELPLGNLVLVKLHVQGSFLPLSFCLILSPTDCTFQKDLETH